MLRFIRHQPPFILLMLASALLMMAPAMHAARLGDWLIARTFLYHGMFVVILAVMLAIGLEGRASIGTQRAERPGSGSSGDGTVPKSLRENQLVSLLLAYLILPAVLALPFTHVVPSITWVQGYFEMLSSLTTTGATVFDPAWDLAEPLHLWRGIVGWLGGFMFLVAALAILEPLKLGGFELQATIGASAAPNRKVRSGSLQSNERILRYAQLVIVPYAVLTAALTLGLVLAGDRSLVAVMHAMGTLATSGITPLQSYAHAGSGHPGEVLVFIFFFAAVTQKSMTRLFRRDILAVGGLDPEVKLALVCISLVTGLLFLRHFLGAVDVEDQQNWQSAMRAIWGTGFGVLSFLTTTGYESQDWEAARNWSGLSTPGFVLLGLCVMGGGIATTAGGVKLLRVYALYKHGAREMGRLIHPNSVGGSGITARRIRREGAAIAWLFLMLFLIGIAFTLLALTAAGQDFEAAMALSIAMLTNTGPASFVLTDTVIFAQMSDVTYAILSAAMIFGRLEALVVIALFNPNFWRA
ncbi:TrkH family potassium uptake protein [Algicella marina]|uniref:TrkH family potassium uptake protein n=1 Tax=Algicella marina TaxID=2683284 RepID=A0A6P1T0I1_9RHOB|nr:potassium transporter TrkG [Algicella marina]QHQ34799.1 TrkH family potassium uptake protein [Algicella marina]